MSEIKLTRGYVAFLDDADYALIAGMGKWSASPDGRTTYALKKVREGDRYRTVLMHSVLTGWSYVDHINGNGLDNRRANLRVASYSQNQGNRRISANNTSGFKGVYWDANWGRWVARIVFEGKRQRLGGYETAEAAGRAYDAAALALFGEYARLNFPEETGQ